MLLACTESSDREYLKVLENLISTSAERISIGRAWRASRGRLFDTRSQAAESSTRRMARTGYVKKRKECTS
jgi:hypothetical protein